MENLGIVKERNGKKIKIEMFQNSACGKCDHCSGEHRLPEIIELEAPFELFVGENVIVEINDSEVFKIGAITYLFPIFGFFIGYILSSYITNLELYRIFSSFLGACITFIFIGIYDKFHSKRKSPFRIKKV